MLSVDKAITLIDQTPCGRIRVLKPLDQALGAVLAEGIVAPMSLPPFRQAAMDGYALIYADVPVFDVVGEVKAGDLEPKTLKPGQAMRIFTGARVPVGADTVVMQEHTEEQDLRMRLTRPIIPYRHIRQVGEQIEQGTEVFSPGTFLHEATIGLLASLGISQVWVYRSPKVSILLTGNELVPLGQQLAPGQMYASNDVMLKAALQQARVESPQLIRVKDDLQATQTLLGQALDTSDAVLVSGGVSVGKYDLVRPALAALGVECLFYKVRQKPGKPLWFGRKGDRFVFAMPGNPAASLTCYYLYVLPFIRRFRGYPSPHLPKGETILAGEVANPAPRTLFLQARVIDGQAHPLLSQPSSALQSFAQANALLVVPPNTDVLHKGAQIQYIDLMDRYRG